MVVSIRAIGETARTDLLRQTQSVQAYVEDSLEDGRDIRSGLALSRLVPSGRRVTVLLAATSNHAADRVVDGPDPGASAITQTLPVLSGRGSVTVAAPIGPIHTDQIQIGLLVASLAVLSALVATAVALFSARRLSGPLLQVADRAAALGDGDFRTSPARHGIPELDRVSDVLDTSAAEIADLVRRERDLAGDVSHQLRTRLTALQIRLEEIALSEDETVRSEANEAIEQAERLAGVIDQLLADARHARARSAQSIDVHAEVATIVEEFQPAVLAAGRRVHLDLEPGLAAFATPGRLHQAVGVLVDNAVQHGDGIIEVSSRGSGRNVVIEVADSGPGVDEAAVATLFERGVSGAGRTGIGLALARALVDADGGRLELRRAAPAVFAVYLDRSSGDDSSS